MEYINLTLKKKIDLGLNGAKLLEETKLKLANETEQAIADKDNAYKRLYEVKEECKELQNKLDDKDKFIENLNKRVEDVVFDLTEKTSFINKIYHKLNTKLYPEQKKAIFKEFEMFSEKFDTKANSLIQLYEENHVKNRLLKEECNNKIN